MSDFFRELINVKCNFVTKEGTFSDYTLVDVSSDWVAIEKDTETIYLNLRHVISVQVAKIDE
ncbi:MAG: hypothetical protein IJ806_07945 [Ruminococcus sp.]|nr:hypothetical protein [Ruminococcus sp.]